MLTIDNRPTPIRPIRCGFKPHRGGCDNIATQTVTYPPGTPAIPLCDECLDMALAAFLRIGVASENVDIRPI